MSNVHITRQTINIREKTNQRIRDLGDKYFMIKTLFDKYSLKRDAIFTIGKQLEEEFKNIKNGIHLQNQAKRMKEALYCWYAENFFEELTQPNSVLLKRIVENAKIISFMTSDPCLCTKNKQPKTTCSDSKKIPAKQNNNNNQNQMKINQEVDTFLFSNISNDNVCGNESKSVQHNDNFNFDDLLNF